MNTRQNSIDAYIEIVNSGELGERQLQILQFIHRHPNCTYNEIARVLGLHHNVVTARIKELRDMGYIVCSGSKKDEFTNKNNSTYRVRKEGEDPDPATVRKNTPVLPRKVIDFLIEKTKKDAEHGEVQVITKGIIITAFRDKDRVCLNYGNFLKLRRVMVVCEDIAHNRVIVSGENFTVEFRIN